MPCFTQIQIALDSGKFNTEVLTRALRALGYDVTDTPLSNGVPPMLFFDREQDNDSAVRGSFWLKRPQPLELKASDPERGAKALGEIRAAYTREALTQAARRHGMKVEADSQNPAVLRLRAGG
jgi:hypothetical protein